MTDMTERLQPRTYSTATCPDELHQHSWRRRQPDPDGVAELLQYYAEPNGSVVISEEALSSLLREAGYEPEHGR